MKIAFYLSSHGYGHATRQIAVMQALVARDPGCKIYVRTGLPAVLAADCGITNIELSDVKLDAGVIEKDIFSQDIHSTLTGCATILAGKSALIDREVTFLEQEKVDRIVSDTPPLASEIGHAANVRTIAVGNFSWDYIYAPYTEKYRDFQWIVTEFEEAYRKTSLFLRLPFHQKSTVFPKVEEIPLIARKAALNTRETLKELGIDPDEHNPIVLAAFRGKHLLLKSALEELMKLKKYIFLMPDPPESNGVLAEAPNVIFLGGKSHTIDFPSLVAASDVVVSKLGYGIVSECIAGRTRLLYIPRHDFVEARLIEEGIKDLFPSVLIPESNFLSGGWSDHLDALVHRDFGWVDIPMSGAEVAAKRILDSN